jgi:predicted transcriptional regulator
MNILTLLLRNNYCVRTLANELNLTEATISQHLKVLREAGLLVGKSVDISCTVLWSGHVARTGKGDQLSGRY